jgi:HAD superfamily hydrolase (TIGR01484 family)
MKSFVVFDLDGTLALSKEAIDPDMAGLLSGLLNVCSVCIISGGDWPQFQSQIVARLPKGTRLDRLHLMPTTGAKYYQFEGTWKEVYAEALTDEQRQRIHAALDGAIAETGLKPAMIWGEQIEDRGTQITFSALGQQAPGDAKSTWDPDQKKRQALKAILDKSLGDLSVRIGGSTSIDITQRGVDKAYGLRHLSDRTGVALSDMMFVGDALYPGGNDAPARDAGVATVAVKTVDDTKAMIDGLIKFAS